MCSWCDTLLHQTLSSWEPWVMRSRNHLRFPMPHGTVIWCERPTDRSRTRSEAALPACLGRAVSHACDPWGHALILVQGVLGFQGVGGLWFLKLPIGRLQLAWHTPRATSVIPQHHSGVDLTTFSHRCAPSSKTT